ncbi:MAG: hypothetical protein ACHQII_05055, partial [Bacteroidia bacterium]
QYIFLLTFALLANSFTHKNLNEYGKWLQFYKLKHEDFIKKGTQQKIKPNWQPYDISNEDKKLYNSLFFYSADSGYYLDLDSYSILLDKDFKGNVTWGGGDPETKVQLINTKLQTSLTLLFFGSREYPETAIWRNKSLFEICAFKEENNIFIPTLWKFDLTTMTYQEFENKKTFKSRPKSYLIEERLKNIKMK